MAKQAHLTPVKNTTFLTKLPQYTLQKVTHNILSVVLVYAEVKIFVAVNSVFVYD